MSTTYNRYIVPCITEGVGVETGFMTTVPTACPNNNTHTVDSNGIRVIGTMSDSTVVIKQNVDTNVGPYYRTDFFEMDIDPNTSATKDIVYPYNIVVYNTTYFVTTENIGDSLTIIGIPDKTIGQLGANFSTGSTTLTISPIYFTLNPGLHLKVTDNTNTDDLGEIKSINPVTGVVTITNPPTHDYVIGNFIKINIYRIKNMKFIDIENFTIGTNKLQATGLPANAIVRFIYTNNSNVSKKFYFKMELQH